MAQLLRLIGMVVVLTVALAASGPGTAAEAPEKAAPPEKDEAAVEPGSDEATAPEPARAQEPRLSHQMAYVDPTTGKLTKPSAAVRAMGATERILLFDTSSEQVEAVPGPKGGFLIDLRGRPHTFLVATVDENGEVRIRHAAVDEPAEEKE